MFISHANILNFRALQSVSVPLNQFSVLLGENDVGKTSFLYALGTYVGARWQKVLCDINGAKWAVTT